MDDGLKFEFVPSEDFIDDYLSVFNHGNFWGERTRPDVTSTHAPSWCEPVDREWVKKSLSENFARGLGNAYREGVMFASEAGYELEKLTVAIADTETFIGAVQWGLRCWYDAKVKKGHADRLITELARNLRCQLKKSGGRILYHEFKHAHDDGVEKMYLVMRDDRCVDLEIENPDYNREKFYGPDGKPLPPLPPLDPHT